MALGLRGPMAVPPPPPQAGATHGGAQESGTGTRREREKHTEPVSGKQEFISLPLNMEVLEPCWRVTSCRAGESPEGQWPSSLGGAGVPWANGPACPGQDPRGCGGCPGQRDQPPPVPAAAPPGAAPALQGQAQVSGGRDPCGGRPLTCRLPPRRGSVQGCWRRPGWVWESPRGRGCGRSWRSRSWRFCSWMGWS